MVGNIKQIFQNYFLFKPAWWNQGIAKERMMDPQNIKREESLSIPIKKISCSFRELRLIHPQSEQATVASIERSGLLYPIVVGKSEENNEKYELIDGFKRFRACKQLGYEKIDARVLYLPKRLIKVLIITLNRGHRAIDSLEEAMVIKSLKDEDKLNQVQIAALFSRNKSWVSRRLALINQLDEKILNNIKLGLISISFARELSRLPRGNQENVIKTINKHGFTYCETKKFIDVFIDSSQKVQSELLNNPQVILSSRSKKNNKKTHKKVSSNTSRFIGEKLKSIDQICLVLTDRIKNQSEALSRVSKREQQQLMSYFKMTKNAFDILEENLQEVIK